MTKRRVAVKDDTVSNEAKMLGIAFSMLLVAVLVIGLIIGRPTAHGDTEWTYSDQQMEKIVYDIHASGLKLVHCRIARATMICEEMPGSCDIGRMAIEGGSIQANLHSNQLIETLGGDVEKIRMVREEELARLKIDLDACTGFELDHSLQELTDEAFRLRVLKIAGGMR